MPDYEWTRDDRGVDTYSKDYPFDAGDKHTFEWVVNNFGELWDAFPDVTVPHMHLVTNEWGEFICYERSN